MKIPTTIIIAIFLVIGTAFAYNVGDEACQYSQGESLDNSPDDCQPSVTNSLRCLYNEDNCFYENMRSNVAIYSMMFLGGIILIYNFATNKSSRTILRQRQNAKDKKIIWKK